MLATSSICIEVVCAWMSLPHNILSSHYSSGIKIFELKLNFVNSSMNEITYFDQNYIIVQGNFESLHSTQAFKKRNRKTS